MEYMVSTYSITWDNTLDATTRTTGGSMTLLEGIVAFCSISVLFTTIIILVSWVNIREQGFTWKEWDRIQQARREFEHEKAMRWVRAWEEKKAQESRNEY